MSHARVGARLARQHGAITRAQALADGLTSSQVRTEVTTGRWSTHSPGVYIDTASRDTWLRRVTLATLVSGGVVSHRSALRLHGLRERSTLVEVSVPHGRWKRPDGFRLHVTRQPELVDQIELEHLPCTGLARTLIDVGLLVTERELDELVDTVLRDGRLRLGDLVAAYRRASEHGRNGCGPMRRLLEARVDSDPVPLSIWSRDVVRLLTSHGVEAPTMEYPVRASDGRIVAQVDLAYPRYRIAIELDSVRWHLDRTAFQRDRERANALALHGWKLLSYTWERFEHHPEQIVRDVRDLITVSRLASSR